MIVSLMISIIVWQISGETSVEGGKKIGRASWLKNQIAIHTG
jgi:hypothetical protein